MLVGLIHLLVSEPDDDDDDLGILYLILGAEIYRQDVEDRRCKKRGGRYGPRGPYQKNRSQVFIDALIDKANDRFFKNWFRSVCFSLGRCVRDAQSILAPSQR
jgi:hypothetical protein